MSAGTNYQRQIRAKCGNMWTSYTSSVSFKTPVSGIAIKTIEESTNGENTASLKLHPNPTNGAFNLGLRQPDVLATTATINVREISGRIEKTGLAKGLLKTSMRLPVSATAGMYLVEIIIGHDVYKTKVVLIK